MGKPALLSLALAAFFFLPRAASAQDDPPSRVARLAFIRGVVSFNPAGTDDWIDAPINRPLTTGDALWSDIGSVAALHLGSASIDLNENTEFNFLNLDDRNVQIQLTGGSIRLRVKRLSDDENFEVDTPNLAFSILRAGIYRISVNAAGDTTVIEDRRGEGEVTGGGNAYTVHAGDIGTFFGTYRLSTDVQYLDNNHTDDFERWCEQRDHHEDISISARYVSDDAIGYDDLDDNGGWRPSPEYGMVWFPYTSSPNWAPYHDGHWTYVSPWGYTWVDKAPWGFAPFHYGRWVNVGGAWGWIPCPPRPPAPTPEYVRPVYAPALVAWVGGPRFGLSVAVGAVSVGVGWFPLGPREVYVPSYPVSRNYVNNVNVSNTTVNKTVVNNYYTTVVVNKTVNVTNVTYVNQRVPGAVVVTTPQAFSSGQSVAKNVVRVDAREVAAAPVTAITPPAVPQRAAVLGGNAMARVRPPAAVQARAVVVKTAPPPPPPTFMKRQAAIQSNGGRPLSLAEARQIAPVRTQTAAAPQVKVAPPAPKPVEVRSVQPSRNPLPAPQQPAQNSPNHAPQPPPVQNIPNHPPQPQPAAANNASKSAAPPSAFPHDERLEQQHQQELMNQRQQQDQERQKLEQQQQQQAQQMQKQKADAAKLQAVEQQQKQQLQELQKKQQQEQQLLRQKQEEQHRAEQQREHPAKPKPEPKPKDEKEPK